MAFAMVPMKKWLAARIVRPPRSVNCLRRSVSGSLRFVSPSIPSKTTSIFARSIERSTAPGPYVEVVHVEMGPLDQILPDLEEIRIAGRETGERGLDDEQPRQARHLGSHPRTHRDRDLSRPSANCAARRISPRRRRVSTETQMSQ